jgi:DNA polymerase-3 subunit delta'
MPFGDIVGHQRQLVYLRRSLECDRLHHAYLFVGPQGAGKRTVALALAKSLHCSARRFDFCDECQVCLAIQAGNHPDVRLVEPLAGKKDISIGQIRDLEKALAFRSFSGGRKITLIDGADLMNFHSQNSLLKTLEEPPGNALVLLIAHSPGGLLPTVLSRCVRLFFGLPPVAAVADFLMEHKGLARERASLLAALTMGSVGEALSCDESEILQQRRRWIDRVSSLPLGGYREAVALAEEMASDKEKCFRALRWIEGWYRDVLIYQVAGETGTLRNVDMVETIRKQAMDSSRDHILFALSCLAQVAEELPRNYNRRLTLEHCLVRIMDHKSGTASGLG